MPDELPAGHAARLFVTAKELGQAAAMFNRFLKPKKRLGEAVLSLQNSRLRIDLGKTAYTVSARGTWPAAIRVRSDLFLGLAGLQSDEEVELAVVVTCSRILSQRKRDSSTEACGGDSALA